MRTTVNLPPAIHALVKSLAAENSQSVSATVAELVAKGARLTPGASVLKTSPVTGLPVVSIGRTLTSKDVADLLEDD